MNGNRNHNFQCVVLVLVLVATFSQQAIAAAPYPDWWENYQHRTAGTKSTTLYAEASTTNSIYVANDENLSKKKTVFVEVGWVDDSLIGHPKFLGAGITWPINNATAQTDDEMSLVANSRGFILDSSGLIVGLKYKAFYSYTIPVQPAFEYVDLKWGLDSIVSQAYYSDFNYTYDIRTTCVPEPGSAAMMFCGFGVLLVGCSRRLKLDPRLTAVF